MVFLCPWFDSTSPQISKRVIGHSEMKKLFHDATLKLIEKIGFASLMKDFFTPVNNPNRTARFWNSLPIEWFPLTYDLNGFKFRINRHLSTVGSF